jgi:hypothetical protein
MIALMVGASVASTCLAAPASARLREDVVPDAEAAKRIARSIVESSMKPESYAESWAHKFLVAKLEGGVWTVSFHEEDPLNPPVPGPGEVLVSADRGGYAEVKLSKHNAKVHSIFWGR